MIRLTIPRDYAATLQRALDRHCKHVAEAQGRAWPEHAPSYAAELDRARRAYFILAGLLQEPEPCEYFGA